MLFFHITNVLFSVSVKESCPNTLDTSKGVIYSPNYPMNYDNGIKCFWDVVVPRKRLLRFQLMDFKTEWRHDMVVFNHVTDGLYVTDITVLHGDNIFDLMFRTDNRNRFVAEFTNRLLIDFASDCFVTNKGFKMKYFLIGTS